MKSFTYEELVQYRPTGRDCNWQFPIRKTRKDTHKMKFKELPQETSGGLFVKLAANDAIMGVFRGEPYDYRQHWLGERSEKCVGDNCPHCAKGIRSNFRFRINFMVKEGSVYVPKIFEQGRRVYEMLRGLHADYDLEHTVVKITRHGSGQKDTTYTVLPVPKATLTKEALEALSKIKLHDLVNPIEEETESFSDSDVPF